MLLVGPTTMLVPGVPPEPSLTVFVTVIFGLSTTVTARPVTVALGVIEYVVFPDVTVAVSLVWLEVIAVVRHW